MYFVLLIGMMIGAIYTTIKFNIQPQVSTTTHLLFGTFFLSMFLSFIWLLNYNSQSNIGQEQENMKPKLKNDTQAVSPIIAVILMVAITVVLAATVFVLVSDIGNNVNAPNGVLNANKEEDTDRVSIVSVGDGLDWTNYQFSTNQNVRFKLNAEVVATDTSSSANTWTTASSTSDVIQPGEFIDVCGQSGALTNLQFSLRNGQSIVGTWTFDTIRAC